jgi:glycosyltransferase involved in cell wall biosynthesis
MVGQKDYPTLLRAFARLEGAPRLLILGEGPLRAELEALCLSLGIAGRVHMPGFRNRPEAFLARADLFVLSSRFEGFPNVIAEALALGRTVVATDAPGGGRNPGLRGLRVSGSGRRRGRARPGHGPGSGRACRSGAGKGKGGGFCHRGGGAPL